jgi:hypothetical protein
MVAIAFAQDPVSKTLEAKVTYNGAGEVDSTHAIHIYLFDTPDISSGAMPIGWNSSYKNGAAVTMSGISASTVYLVVAYGDYDVTPGPPPSGTPVSFYLPGNPDPTPIEMDKAKVEIAFEFDDSAKMP